MGRAHDDLAGKRFTHLVATDYMGTDKRQQALWLCKCDCGNTKVVRASKLKDGEVKSCGCMHRKYGHGMSESRLYAIWCTMKARCNRPTSEKYASYGGRGIEVCQEWNNSFETFMDWALANGYQDGLSIDRKDNDGPYCPENCRWVTSLEQANNTRANRVLEYNGERHTIAEWARSAGMPYELVYKRIKRGWDIGRAIADGGACR